MNKQMLPLLALATALSGCGDKMEKRTAQTPQQREALERQEDAERHGYTISADGQTVTDKKTGLVWMRCSLGQNWNGSQCAGSANEYPWEQARQAARGYSHAGHSDWRLPSIGELKTLVYCSSGQRNSFSDDNVGDICEGTYNGPAIVESAFPDTPSSNVWSGSPDPFLKRMRYVGFYYGSAGVGYRDDGNHVRLVRGGQ